MDKTIADKIVKAVVDSTDVPFRDYLELRKKRYDTTNKYRDIIIKKLDVIYHFADLEITSDDHDSLVERCVKELRNGG